MSDVCEAVSSLCGCWCKDYDHKQQQLRRNIEANIVLKCYCGNKELVISSIVLL